jgi:hypothetical protein
MQDAVSLCIHIQVVKKAPQYLRGFLQLTTYETQTSYFQSAALSPSPQPRGSDTIGMRRGAPVFKISLKF